MYIFLWSWLIYLLYKYVLLFYVFVYAMNFKF